MTFDTSAAEFFDLAAILPFAQRWIFEIKVGLRDRRCLQQWSRQIISRPDQIHWLRKLAGLQAEGSEGSS